MDAGAAGVDAHLGPWQELAPGVWRTVVSGVETHREQDVEGHRLTVATARADLQRWLGGRQVDAEQPGLQAAGAGQVVVVAVRGHSQRAVPREVPPDQAGAVHRLALAGPCEQGSGGDTALLSLPRELVDHLAGTRRLRRASTSAATFHLFARTAAA